MTAIFTKYKICVISLIKKINLIIKIKSHFETPNTQYRNDIAKQK